LLLLITLLAGCGGGEKYQAPPANAEVNVAVSILPQQYFVRKIGGEHVSVLVMAGPGINPLHYQPPKGQLEALKERDIYFLMGIPSEKTWLASIAEKAPDIILLDSSQEVDKSNGDPHVWLSPQRVAQQAQTIAQGLIAVDPDHEADYRANLQAFLAELDKLDADIRRVMEKNNTAGKTFIVSHPAWSYFAQDYGLTMLSIPENATDAQLQALADQAKAKGIDIIFYQRGFDEKSPEKLSQMLEGGRVMPMEPLNPSWEPNLRSVSMMLARSVK
jgi:zinc transport system substrate-binding protein